MSRKEIISAIERTIEETKAYERENSEDCITVIHMNEHRANLETQLGMYSYTHPGPLRTVATSLLAPVGFVLSPAIIVGGLAYLGGRAISGRIKEHYSK